MRVVSGRAGVQEMHEIVSGARHERHLCLLLCTVHQVKASKYVTLSAKSSHILPRKRLLFAERVTYDVSHCKVPDCVNKN